MKSGIHTAERSFKMFSNFDFELFGRAMLTILLFGGFTAAVYKIYTSIEKAVKTALNRKKQPIKRTEDDFFFGELKDIHDFK